MYKDYRLCGKWQSTIRRFTCTNDNTVVDPSCSSAKTIINYEEVKAWGASFTRLLQNAIGRNLFKQHLIQEHAEEALQFWESVEVYKRLVHQDDLEEMAREIYNQFISSRAKMEISIDSKCRSALAKSVKQPTKTTFDDAQQQILKYMETDNYERFKRSKIYMSFLLQQIPHDAVDEWGDSMDKLLQYDEGRYLLEEFLINEKSEENLRFWLEVQDYKKCTNIALRKARAADIYNRFVNPQAKSEISIDGPTRNTITAEYENGDEKLFDKAGEHIYVLMRGDCYPRFAKSKYFRNFLESHKKASENRREAKGSPVEKEPH